MKRNFLASSVVLRALGFAGLWGLMSEHAWHEWPLISLTIAVAITASFALLPAGGRRLPVGPLLRFIPYFLRESLAGGVDVARRSFSLPMRLNPGLRTYPLALRREASQVFFAWCVSLLPGTASVRLCPTGLVVHVLDTQLATEHKLLELERHIGALFGDWPD